MARQESDRLPGKLELVATLDRTRAALSRDLGGMGRVLDLSTQFRQSYASGWWKWLVGALALGVVAGLRFVPPVGKGSGTTSRPGSATAASPANNTPPRPSGPGPMMANLGGMILRQLVIGAAQPALSRFLGQEIEKWLSAVLRKP